MRRRRRHLRPGIRTRPWAPVVEWAAILVCVHSTTAGASAAHGIPSPRRPCLCSLIHRGGDRRSRRHRVPPCRGTALGVSSRWKQIDAWRLPTVWVGSSCLSSLVPRYPAVQMMPMVKPPRSRCARGARTGTLTRPRRLRCPLPMVVAAAAAGAPVQTRYTLHTPRHYHRRGWPRRRHQRCSRGSVLRPLPRRQLLPSP